MTSAPTTAATKAVLFDFDGTLIDSYPAITASVNHVRSLRGLPPLTVDEVTPHVGRGPAHLLTETVGVGDSAANVEAYRAHHPTVMGRLTRLLPGAAEVLQGLKRRGVATGICSNKPAAFTRELVVTLGIAAWLDLLLGPEDVGRRHKPAPDMLIVAMQRLAVQAEQTVYVGDMGVDVQTARGAGVRAWVVPTGSDTPQALDAAGPDRRLNDLAEILALLPTPGARDEG
jgi:phosphoglycolate phosphatase